MARFSWGIFLLFIVFSPLLLFAAPPSAISDLTALTGFGDGEIILRWTAPGSDGTSGVVTAYAVRYATSEISSGDFDSGWVFVYSTAGWNNFVAAGETEERLLTGLSPRATYYFAIKGQNSVGEFGLWRSSSETSGICNSLSRAVVGNFSPSVVDISSVIPNWRQVTLSWITPGDDGTVGDIVNGSFTIKLSSGGAILTEGDWANVGLSYPYTISRTTTIAVGFSAGSTITGLTNGVTYYFAVRYYDEVGNSSPLSLISPATFPYNIVPATFSLLSPADDTIVNTSTPTFSWSASEDDDAAFGDSVSYYLSYSTDSSFSAGVTTTVVTAVPSYIPTHYLLEDKTYYWKVIARDLDNAQRAAANNFYRVKINTANSAPSPFLLIAPATGQIVNTASPQLSWNAAFDPDPGDVLSYQVFYSTDSQFSVYFSSSGISGTSFTAQNLSDNSTYYWKVKVTDGQLSNWSTTTSYFLVNYIPEPPRPFNLSLPLNTTRQLTTNVSFIWQATTDPDPKETVTYNLIYSNFANFVTSITISGLVQSTTMLYLTDNLWYYWKVRAVGSDGQSCLSNQTYSFYVDTVKQLPADFRLFYPTGNVIVNNTLRPVFQWENAVDPDPADLVQYGIMISEKEDFSDGQWLAVGATNFYQPAVNLSDETTYYWKVRATGSDSDAGYTNSSTGTFIISLINNPPQSFNLISPAASANVFSRYPSFSWEKAVDGDPGASVTYILEISTVSNFSVLFSSVGNILAENYTLTTPLKENLTYYWRVTARDNKNALTSCSGSFQFYLPVVSVLQQVICFQGQFSSDRKDYQLTWQAVTKNVDGTPADDLKEYQIYRAFTLADLFKPESLLATTTATYYLDKNILGADLYYCVRAIDVSGVFGPYSVILRTQADGAGYFYSSDRTVLLEIPAEVNSLLNRTTAPCRLEVKSCSDTTDADILSAYEINLYDAGSDKLLSAQSLPKPLKLKFYYSGVLATVAKKGIRPSPVNEDNLCFYWYNGKQFLRLGGEVDKNQQTISLFINRTGIYQIRPVIRATNLAVTVNPRRVITPGVAPYEKFQLFVENPRGELVRGKIFNLKGERIVDLAPLTDPTGSTVILEWDGTDEKGQIVSGGVYLYYVESGSEAKSGTVLIAK